jgi:hypothetical protein
MGNAKTVFARIATGRRNRLIVGESILSPAYYREVKDLDELRRVSDNNLEVWTETVKNKRVSKSEPMLHVISIDNETLKNLLKQEHPKVNRKPIKMIEPTANKQVDSIEFEEIEVNGHAAHINEVMAPPATEDKPVKEPAKEPAKEPEAGFKTVSENGTGEKPTGKKRGRKPGS